MFAPLRLVRPSVNDLQMEPVEPKNGGVEERRWWVYMVRTSRQALYTGITLDIDRRMAEHNGKGLRGAKALRGQRPVYLVWKQGPLAHAEALKQERDIKKMNKRQKENLVS